MQWMKKDSNGLSDWLWALFTNHSINCGLSETSCSHVQNVLSHDISWLFRHNFRLTVKWVLCDARSNEPHDIQKKNTIPVESEAFSKITSPNHTPSPRLMGTNRFMISIKFHGMFHKSHSSGYCRGLNQIGNNNIQTMIVFCMAAARRKFLIVRTNHRPRVYQPVWRLSEWRQSDCTRHVVSDEQIAENKNYLTS